MHLKLAIGIAEPEILNEEILDLRVFGDGTGAVAHILELLFFEIVLVQVLVQAVIRVIVTFLVFRQDASYAVQNPTSCCVSLSKMPQ